jgi:ZIP family zinc transporter
MSLTRTLVLGFIAGVTIVLGLPIGRIRRPTPRLAAFLNAIAVGVLLFLVWDVLSAGWEPVDGALGAVHDHSGGLGPVFGYGGLFVGGLCVGLLSLVAYERWMRTRAEDALAAGSTPGRRLALLIAVGIGLHNFAEGLAIGQAAARSEISLAVLLVIGFGLHNATEGFGIVAPLTAEAGELEHAAGRPSWSYLLGLAAIGGGPTFLGTIVGHGFTSNAVSVVFLTLAAGSIIYVVIQLLSVAAKLRLPEILAYGLLTGVIAGFATDAVVTAAGV